MDIDQIAQLVETSESETLEFKETTGTRREASRTVCAFLNQRGGQVLFGVTAAGVVAGQQVSDRTIEELSAELQRIDPPAFPTVERIRVDGNREVVVVSADQGTLKAVYLPRHRLQSSREHNTGNVRRRVQPHTLRADAQRATLGEPARRWVGDQ